MKNGLKIFLLLIILAFIGLRLESLSLHFNEFLNQMQDMLIYKSGYSYDQKMLERRGKVYLFAKKINDSTPGNATINLFYEDSKIIRSDVLAYFIYPRKIKIVSDGEIDGLTKNILNETYILFLDNPSKYKIEAKKIIIFGNSLAEENNIYYNSDYLSDSLHFEGVAGLIKI